MIDELLEHVFAETALVLDLDEFEFNRACITVGGDGQLADESSIQEGKDRIEPTIVRSFRNAILNLRRRKGSIPQDRVYGTKGSFINKVAGSVVSGSNTGVWSTRSRSVRSSGRLRAS